MKLTKLSLVAALAASAAFAGGDIKPAAEPKPVEAASPWSLSGDAKLFYATTDGEGVDLFAQESAIGQVALSADVSYSFANTWKANVGMTGLATLGLDDNVVGDVWLYAGANASDGSLPFTSIGDALWIDTANVTGTAYDGKATLILGRTELDTPLAFTETWSIANNTFDAAVAMINPMDKLTLVAGYIYDGNGNGERISTLGGGFTGSDGYFPFADAEAGAWTVAAIGKFDTVTAQAWYYDVMDVAQAVWLQADGNFKGFAVGAQYAYIDPSDLGFDNFESSAFAVKLGYEMDAISLWAAYSKVDDEGLVSISNTATMLSGAGWGGASGYPSGQSKLYTEAWWNYGFVGLPGASTFAIAAEYKLNDDWSFTAQYNAVADAQNTMVAALFDEPLATTDMNELALVAETTLYGLDVALAYVYSDYSVESLDAEYAAAGTFDNNSLQAYLTYKF